jgi:hypothetical protein
MRAIAGVFALTFPIAFGLIVLGLPATHAAAADRKISDFYGAYTGQSISLKGEGLSARDLSVRIKPNKQGFNLSWTTVTHKKGSSAVRKSYSIDFSKSPRKNMWGSAVRRDPFVWATLKGDTLTVYALIITASGGYELQTYARTLTADGMRLNFTRLRDGERLKAITGVLVKKK